MVGIEINRTYKYEGVVLESGAKVTATNVTVENGKVVYIENANAQVESGNINFSIYNYGIEGAKTYNINGVPENVDGQALIKEFVAFVEADIAG